MDTSVLYKSWLDTHNLFFGKQRRIPRQGDDLYLDGYPRSGNTYFTALFRDCFENLRFAHHLHVVAPIKIAMAREIPVFILIRDPRKAVLSHVVQASSAQRPPRAVLEQRLRQMINDYVRYYDFVRDQSDQLAVIDSEEAFRDPFHALRDILRFLAIPVSPELQSNWIEFHRAFQQKDKSKRQGSTSYPSEEREQLKVDLNTMLDEQVFEEAVAVFEEVKGLALNAK